LSAAEADLDDIWLFTFERWGEAQADKYGGALIIAVNALGQKSSDDDGLPRVRHYYRIRVGRHLIFYRASHVYVVVVRVLHESMDASRHLP
jgi:toxin ParE1/3/4